MVAKLQVLLLTQLHPRGVDSSLETYMMCVGHYEIKPLIQEVYREKQMYAY